MNETRKTCITAYWRVFVEDTAERIDPTEELIILLK